MALFMSLHLAIEKATVEENQFLARRAGAQYYRQVAFVWFYEINLRVRTYSRQIIAIQ